ncbi:MAG: hypothetical protein CMM59_20605 [Rhodospirillaceae bacterium]|nr:hypothetical protein [Rhodospirillaceae bacterium]
MRNMRTLTEAQRIQWETDGYIVLEGALNPDEVEFFSNELDEVRKKPGYEPRPGELPRGHYGWVDHADDLNPDGFMDRRDLLPYHKAFRDLIDKPEVFDLVVDIMGPYILFSMSQAIVRRRRIRSPAIPTPTAARDCAASAFPRRAVRSR